MKLVIKTSKLTISLQAPIGLEEERRGEGKREEEAKGKEMERKRKGEGKEERKGKGKELSLLSVF